MHKFKVIAHKRVPKFLKSLKDQNLKMCDATSCTWNPYREYRMFFNVSKQSKMIYVTHIKLKKCIQRSIAAAVVSFSYTMFL